MHQHAGFVVENPSLAYRDGVKPLTREGTGFTAEVDLCARELLRASSWARKVMRWRY